MRRNFSALAGENFDVLIVGGGIFGAGIARDAALRGLKVALVDKGDFASGTSSRSSKLIHGGFRYLEQGALRLVMESCHERQTLQRIAPHLVKQTPFLLPVYRLDPRSLGKMRLGMALYDALAFYRDSRHRTLSPAATLSKEPNLARRGLMGSILYHDCQEDDARLCVENILHAAELGAVCVNYCEVINFSKRDDRIVAARVEDGIGHQSLEIKAKCFINAAGPWVDRVAGLNGAQRPMLRPTKGVHILLPKLTEQDHAITFQGKHDGRIMFIMPWNGCTMVGTTDTDFSGDPNDVRAEAEDVEYLLREVKAMLPGSDVGESDIITTFAGLRPLLNNSENNPSSRTREWQIIHQGPNLMSIAGGKYTTYRAQAEKIVDAALKVLGQHARTCETDTTPLPPPKIDADEMIADVPRVYASDIRRACTSEMAMSVEDVMRRRTSLALSKYGGAETAAAVARIMASSLGWSESQSRLSLQHYLNQWDTARNVVPSAESAA